MYKKKKEVVCMLFSKRINAPVSAGGLLELRWENVLSWDKKNTDKTFIFYKNISKGFLSVILITSSK